MKRAFLYGLLLISPVVIAQENNLSLNALFDLNVEVASGLALNVISVPMLKLAEQVLPQLMPVGDDVTVPPPLPLLLALMV